MRNNKDPLREHAATSGRICLNASEFAYRHALNIYDFYGALQDNLQLLPKLITIAGQLRFSDIDGALGRKFKPKNKPGFLPQNDPSRVLFDVATFCHVYGIDHDMLTRLRISDALPKAMRSKKFPGELYIFGDEISLWEMARQLDPQGMAI